MKQNSAGQQSTGPRMDTAVEPGPTVSHSWSRMIMLRIVLSLLAPPVICAQFIRAFASGLTSVTAGLMVRSTRATNLRNRPQAMEGLDDLD